MTQLPETVQMPYTHLCAWRVIGGLALPFGADNVTLASGEGWAYSLTRDIDTACAIIDRGGALGYLALSGVFGPANVGTHEERLADAIKEIRRTRHKKTGSHAVLLFQATGPAEVNLSNPAHRFDDYVVTFDAFDKAVISAQFVRQHRAMQMALALESKEWVRFEEATAGTYCTNAEGRTVYSMTFSSGRAETIVSSPLKKGEVESIVQRFALINASAHLDSSLRLYADAAIYGREPFRVFLSGWAALEILINKTFKEIGGDSISTLKVPHQPEMLTKFLTSVRDKASGKYSMVDRFNLVSSVLLPLQTAEASEVDLSSFKRMKDLRDAIAHGSTVDEACMPLAELNDIFLKYLAAHAARAAGAATSAARAA